MSSRAGITEKMIKALQSKVNCQNVMKFIDKNEANEVVIVSTRVMVKVVDYNEDSVETSDDGEWDNQRIEHLFSIYDFMVEANHTGYEYFPNLYGVLNCHNGSDSKVYVFAEAFDGGLLELSEKIAHPSDWYDVVFQMIMINYYIEVVNGYYYYGGGLENHLYRKLEKPIYQEYNIGDDGKFRINHKYLIVVWNIDYMVLAKDSKKVFRRNTEMLASYLEEHKETMKVPPSLRVMQLLSDVNGGYSNIAIILNKYYNVE